MSDIVSCPCLLCKENWCLDMCAESTQEGLSFQEMRYTVNLKETRLKMLIQVQR